MKTLRSWRLFKADKKPIRSENLPEVSMIGQQSQDNIMSNAN